MKENFKPLLESDALAGRHFRIFGGGFKENA